MPANDIGIDMGLSLIHIFIVFCRVLDGRVKKGTQIRMMATGFTTEVVEVGYFGAGQFIPVSYTHLDVYKRQAYICPRL